MSLWNIGANDVSEETQSFKDRLAAKDAQIAAQQAKLAKHTQDHDELKAVLNETLQQLHAQSDRALRLETDLAAREEQLQNAQVTNINHEAALAIAEKNLHDQSLQSKHLQTIIDSLSNQSDSTSAEKASLAREKHKLECRVRELEAMVPQTVTLMPGRASRPRSSSLNNLRLASLEDELNKAREAIQSKEASIESSKRKLLLAQADLGRCENEKVAIERQLQTQLVELRDTLEDREEELRFYKDGEAGNGREEELLKRIEEDEAKIAAMETLLRDDKETRELKRKLTQTEKQLQLALLKVAGFEERANTLVAEREEALDQVERLKAELVLPKASSSISDEQAEGIRNALEAVERLRGERDELRRHLEYLEPEHKFTEQALQQARNTITALETQRSSTSSLQSDHTTQQAQSALSQQLISKQRGTLHRLELTANVFVVLIAHLNHEHHIQLDIVCNRALALEARVSQAEEREEQAKLAKQDESDLREEMEGRLSDTASALEEAERERANLALRVDHMGEDLKAARCELTEAEERYNTLQSQQLAALNSTDVKKALKGRIEELEGRVLRRNQQIGEHQHDIKRLEMNLKLQEDRLAELTVELQTATTEKANMVLDCADARDARDGALRSLDQLEEQLEEMQKENEELSRKLAEATTAATTSRSTLSIDLSTLRSESASLREKLSEAEALIAQTENNHTADIQRLQAEREQLAALREQESSQTKEIAVEFDYLVAGSRQMTVALALSQLQLKKLSLSQHVRANTLSKECADLRLQVSSLATTNESLTRRVDGLLAEASSSGDQLTKRIHEMTEEVESTRGLLERERQNYEAKLSSIKRELQSEAGILEEQLAELNEQLEQERTASAARLQTLEVALSDSKGRCEELEIYQTQLEEGHKRQEDMAREIAEHRQTAIDRQVQLDSLKAAQVKQMALLQQKLDDLAKSSAVAHQERDSLAQLHAMCGLQHSDMQQKYEERLLTTKNESLRERQAFESEVSTLRADRNNLEQALHAASNKLEALQAEHHSTDRKHEEESQARLADADKARREMEQMMTRMEEELSELDERISALSGDNDRLEAEATGSIAEIQRLTSFQHFLESQAKTHEAKVNELSRALQETEAQLVEAEKNHRDQTTNLTLDNLRLQHDIKSLNLELQQFKTQPDLKTVVAELEEKNHDMEELLKQKCEEIESNDDRIMDMMKEKKKLSTKVDNLTRKMQTLQTKLASAPPSASMAPAPNPTPVPISSTSAPAVVRSKSAIESSASFRSTTFSAPAPPIPSVRTRGPTRDSPAALEASTSSRRVVSTSSLNQFPSTFLLQDKATPGPPIFPDVQAGHSGKSSETYKRPVSFSVAPAGDPSPALGKRRRLHDEPEDEEDVPPSAFSAEVVPDTQQSRTPRSRKVFSAVHSGFTPVRRHATAIVRSISPSRSKPAKAPIADVTNARPPLSQDKAAKRTWLGKLRTGGGSVGDADSLYRTDERP